jgi:hypothetical protein
MSSSRVRWPTCLALLASVLLAGQALAATWTAPSAVTPNHAWSGPGSLARTGGPTPYLHMVYTTDRIGGVQVSDGGPYQGVFYRRRAQNGTTWSAPKRLSQPGKHADRPVIVATDELVTVMWQTFESYDHPDTSADRRLWLRQSDDRGSTWMPAKERSNPAGDPGYPMEPHAIGAAGNEVVYAEMRSSSGDIFVWDYTCDGQGGCGGSGSAQGHTTNPGPHGFAGYPAFDVSGRKFALAWMADGSGTIKARFATDWRFGPTVTVATGSRHTRAGIGIDIAGDRAVVAWSTGSSIKVRVRTGSTFGPVRTIASFSAGGTFKSGYLPAVQLVGSQGIGVGWSECRRADCSASAGSRAGVDLAWRESSDNGAHWSSKTTLANASTTADGRRSEAPSIAWAGAATRFVLFSTSSANHALERVDLRRGSGAP